MAPISENQDTETLFIRIKLHKTAIRRVRDELQRENEDLEQYTKIRKNVIVDDLEVFKYSDWSEPQASVT